MQIEPSAADCCGDPASPARLADQTRDRLVAVFRALGDPTRFDIFRFIATQSEPICVCYVVDRFPVSQPTISYHLRVLRDAGLVSVSRRGVWAYYSATEEGVGMLEQASEALRGGVVTVGK